MNRCGHCKSPMAEGKVRCGLCRRWGLPVDEAHPEAEGGQGHVSLGKVKASELARLSGFQGPVARAFDKAVSRFVRGGVYLFSGDPGAGKSTVTLQLVAGFDGRARIVLGEEMKEAVKERANRLGLRQVGHVDVIETNDVDEVLDVDEPYQLTIIDSLDALGDAEVGGTPGTAHQKSAVLHKLEKYARVTKETLVVLSHVNKQGEYAGGMDLSHLVTATLHFEKTDEVLRTLKASKNRGGPITHVNALGELDGSAAFRMTELGLEVAGSRAENTRSRIAARAAAAGRKETRS
ncbi:MAG TPA: hypothetical protein VN032_09210 [Thermoanaerobaculia bacterium]|jgi:DNA repair protein RadA/Sms|nr:hypothetical protein [Thermoanaerobaculia bacterium]